MAPAIITRILYVMQPSVGNDVTAPDFGPSVVLNAGCLLLDALTLWFCGAALVLGVRSIGNGEKPRALAWLAASVRRTPALLATFTLPILLASVLLIPALVTVYELYRIVSNISLIDPEGFERQLYALRYQALGGTALLIASFPVAFIATAPIMQDGLRLTVALRVVLRTCFSQVSIGRTVALCGAIIALFGVELVVAESFEQIGRFIPGLGPLWMAIIVVVSFAIAAYAAVVVGFAWLDGYLAKKPRKTGLEHLCPTLQTADKWGIVGQSGSLWGLVSLLCPPSRSSRDSSNILWTRKVA